MLSYKYLDMHLHIQAAMKLIEARAWLSPPNFFLLSFYDIFGIWSIIYIVCVIFGWGMRGVYFTHYEQSILSVTPPKLTVFKKKILQAMGLKYVCVGEGRRRRGGGVGGTSRMPWPKLLSLKALQSGWRFQQNFPLAGPVEKFMWHTPPNSGLLSSCLGHFPGSSANSTSTFSMLPPSPTVMYTGPHGFKL